MSRVKRDEHAIERLRSLGLNQLEAEVYVALLRSPEPLTAYALGKQVGRATANVYKAIGVLEERGAVRVEDGERRMCSAVSGDEFVAMLEREAGERARAARDALSGLEADRGGERVYRVQTVAGVMERAARMLNEAEEVVVLDVFPEPLERLRGELEGAVARGVRVYLQVYGRYRLKGAKVVECWQSGEVLRHWGSEQLNLVVDGREVLAALLRRGMEGVHQAVWSNGLYLSCMMHAGFVRENTFHRIMRERERRGAPAWLDRVLDEELFFHTSRVPGQLELFEEEGVGR